MQKLPQVGKFHFDPPPCYTSLDHLVGKADQGIEKVQSQRLGGPEIDDKFELGGLLHRNVGRLGALKDLPDVESGPPEQVMEVWSVRHERAFFRPASQLVNGRQSRARCQCENASLMRKKDRVLDDIQ